MVCIRGLQEESQTPVGINDVLQENVAKTAVINSAAKRVHDLLKECGKRFLKKRCCGQVMLSRMRKAATVEVIVFAVDIERNGTETASIRWTGL